MQKLALGIIKLLKHPIKWCAADYEQVVSILKIKLAMDFRQGPSHARPANAGARASAALARKTLVETLAAAEKDPGVLTRPVTIELEAYGKDGSTIASPSPVPPKRRVMELSAWEKGLKIAAACSGVIPMPVSMTLNAIRGRAASGGSSMRTSRRTPPNSVNLMALPIRLMRI